MKKSAAILALLVLLLQGAGGDWLWQMALNRADRRMQARIDLQRYNPASLLELSVPLSLPYTTNWRDWEHVEGDILIDGIQYRYVARKLTEGRMHLKCIPNGERLQVQALFATQYAFSSRLPFASGQLGQAPVPPPSDYDDTILRPVLDRHPSPGAAWAFAPAAPLPDPLLTSRGKPPQRIR